MTPLSEADICRYYSFRVPRLHRSGSELRGPCPLHHGTRDSFAVSIKTGEWFCHSECDRGGRVFELEATLSGLDLEQARAEVYRIVGHPTSSNRAGNRIVAEYSYADEEGKLLYQCVRYYPKSFKQRRPDGKGDWIWNLKGVRRVLYNLRRVLVAHVVFVVEGEKDADALNDLGVVATTSPMGAGKWRSEYSEQLRGKVAYIIPDGDEPGRKHAAAVLRSLKSVAASVKMLPLPDAKDAAQWIEQGGTLDELMRLAEREEADPEPRKRSKESVPAGSKLLQEIEQLVRRYVVLPDAAYLPVALWALATHAVEQFDCFPYLALLSAAKRSGKTRLAEVLETLVRLPWRGIAPSPASLYRMLTGAPTLLLDETEALNVKNKSESAQTLLAVLNAGHRKGATISRCEPPKFDIRQFPVYGPKLFAAIGKLPDMLVDRSIVIHMKRRSKTQNVERFRQARATAEAKPIHDGASQFVETHSADIERAYQETLERDLEFLNDRDADLWTPLFVLCSVTMPGRLGELKQSALTLSAAKASDDVDDSYSLTLLQDIREVWPPDRIEGQEYKPYDKCESAALVERLKTLEESPWREPPLTTRKLAGILKPYEVAPRTIRREKEEIAEGEKETKKGYYYADFKDAFDRYL